MHKVIGVLGMALMVANGPSAARSPEPAATLLMPRFEVSEDQKYDTTLTVTNRGNALHVVRMTVWSDHGFPLSWFPLTFAPHESKPLVIDRQWCLSPVSSRQVHRIGYVTFDVVRDERAAVFNLDGGAGYAVGLDMANVLTGSFAQHANGEVLGSWSMVHLHARKHLTTTFYGRFSNRADRRESLPSSMTVAMTRGSAAELLIWREPNENSQRCDRIRESSLVLETQSVTNAPDHMTFNGTGQICVLVTKPSPRHQDANLPPLDCYVPPV